MAVFVRFQSFVLRLRYYDLIKIKSQISQCQFLHFIKGSPSNAKFLLNFYICFIVVAAKTGIICNLGLICRRTFPIVFHNCCNPLIGRYDASTGIRTSSEAANAFMVSIPRDGIQSSKFTSYLSFTLFKICFRTNSRLIALTS